MRTYDFKWAGIELHLTCIFSWSARFLVRIQTTNKCLELFFLFSLFFFHLGYKPHILRAVILNMNMLAQLQTSPGLQPMKLRFTNTSIVIQRVVKLMSQLRLASLITIPIHLKLPMISGFRAPISSKKNLLFVLITRR